MTQPSRYMLSAEQTKRYANVSEVRISIWGVVPERLDNLIRTGLWGDTRAQVYYRLAMDKLMEIERELLS